MLITSPGGFHWLALGGLDGRACVLDGFSSVLH